MLEVEIDRCGTLLLLFWSIKQSSERESKEKEEEVKYQNVNRLDSRGNGN